MGIIENLQELKEEKAQCLSLIQDIEAARDAELEAEINRINLKYDELKKEKCQELCEYEDRISSYQGMIKRYSFFGAEEIGKTIASLISSFEGTEYIYQETEYDAYERDDDGLKVRSVQYPRLVVARYKSEPFYVDDGYRSLTSLVRGGNAIILENSSYQGKSPKINFYYLNVDRKHALESTVKYGRFSYVKDFIDELILYKMVHSLDDIPVNDLEELKEKFISSRIKTSNDEDCLQDETLHPESMSDLEQNKGLYLTQSDN